MNKASRFITTALMLAALPAAAQQKASNSSRLTVSIPATRHLSASATAHLNKQLNQFLKAGQSTGSASKNAAGPERLMAQADYEFMSSTGGQLADSLRFVYNNNVRTSAYDYSGLYYDTYNESDLPTGLLGSSGAGYVHYDTMRGTQPGSANLVVTGIRTYNAAGKVTMQDHPEQFYRTYFEYDANGRVKKSTTLDGSGGSGLDSSQRDLYYYDANGFLIADSSFSWDGSAWEHSFTALLTNNAAGHPTQVNVRVNFGIPLTVLQLNTTYNSANLPVTSTYKMLNNPIAPLQNMNKDTFGYSGNMLVYNNSYDWDTTALVWNIRYTERRRLNASSLPDSAWTKYYSNGAATDSSVATISYNAYGNPTIQRRYMGDGTTKQFENRYYYASTAGLIGRSVKKDIAVYPNPAVNELHVKGLSNGRFSIINAAGQVLVQGNLTANAVISLGGIPAGVYQLIADDSSGARHVAGFVKQ